MGEEFPEKKLAMKVSKTNVVRTNEGFSKETVIGIYDEIGGAISNEIAETFLTESLYNGISKAMSTEISKQITEAVLNYLLRNYWRNLHKIVKKIFKGITERNPKATVEGI